MLGALEDRILEPLKEHCGILAYALPVNSGMIARLTLDFELGWNSAYDFAEDAEVRSSLLHRSLAP